MHNALFASILSCCCCHVVLQTGLRCCKKRRLMLQLLASDYSCLLLLVTAFHYCCHLFLFTRSSLLVFLMQTGLHWCTLLFCKKRRLLQLLGPDSQTAAAATYSSRCNIFSLFSSTFITFLVIIRGCIFCIDCKRLET